MKTHQEKAISKFMAARKRQLCNAHSRHYPKFSEGMSTYNYVLSFQDLNMSTYDTRQGQLRFDCKNYFNPAPVLSGPEVIEDALL